MSEFQFIKQEVNDGIATISLNNPRIYNAFDNLLIEELKTSLEHIEKKEEIKVVILRAEGDHFCAGANLKWMQQTINLSEQENKTDALLLAGLLHRLFHFAKPIICLVQGKVIGGGVGLIACADAVIAEPDASFCFSEVTLGLIPATIAPYIVRSIGARYAKYYFISATPFSAEQARHIGLVQSLSSQDGLMTDGLKLAKRICRHGAQAIKAVKSLVNDLTPLEDSVMDHTATCLAQVRVSEEGQEGVRAFLEKRSPKWVKMSD